MDLRDEASAQGGQPAHRGEGARYVEHLARVRHLEHAGDGQPVGLAVGVHQQIPLHRPPFSLPPRRNSSAATRSAI